MGVEVEVRAGVGFPATVGLWEGVEKLVEVAGAGVDDEDVAVAVAVGAAFDGGVGGDREGTGVAFVAVGRVGDVYECLAAGDVDEGYADWPAVPEAGAEIGVQAGGAPDGVDIGVGQGVGGEGGDVAVPD